MQPYGQQQLGGKKPRKEGCKGERGEDKCGKGERSEDKRKTYKGSWAARMEEKDSESGLTCNDAPSLVGGSVHGCIPVCGTFADDRGRRVFRRHCKHGKVIC